MELYTRTSRDLSRLLTLRYSSSFGSSSKLFAASIRDDIFSIYGLVRVADEIVDTYAGTTSQKRQLLDNLESEVKATCKRGYSTNPIVHAYSDVATRYAIDPELLAAFFASMRMDLEPNTYTDELYETYIYGSAEVIGLMCLHVFTNGNKQQYADLTPGARALGAAYQKVNFLRDMAADFTELGRVYFPDVAFETFSDADKDTIIADIESDLNKARPALEKLPSTSRIAVATSYAYYSDLLEQLRRTPASTIKASRLRVSTPRKLWLLARTVITKGGLHA